ncbi:hypothetical protein BD410DRAFT_802366 [Rickenella mellea]|uniref:Uncharacterized protein n=1 Tax=Rickenella mellea TaxID=50990 RepID=A0A4Y7Q9C8_9AGAM|nr:hypothetical protein BD410DRAFT_802366 [Rickenella mellea]
MGNIVSTTQYQCAPFSPASLTTSVSKPRGSGRPQGIDSSPASPQEDHGDGHVVTGMKRKPQTGGDDGDIMDYISRWAGLFPAVTRIVAFSEYSKRNVFKEKLLAALFFLFGGRNFLLAVIFLLLTHVKYSLCHNNNNPMGRVKHTGRGHVIHKICKISRTSQALDIFAGRLYRVLYGHIIINLINNFNASKTYDPHANPSFSRCLFTPESRFGVEDIRNRPRKLMDDRTVYTAMHYPRPSHRLVRFGIRRSEKIAVMPPTVTISFYCTLQSPTGPPRLRVDSLESGWSLGGVWVHLDSTWTPPGIWVDST